MEINEIIENHKHKRLTMEEEARLISIIQRGEDKKGKARNRIIEANLYWSGNFAKKYSFSKLELEDLWEEANRGLNESIDSFDSSLDCRFHTYAEFKMKKNILEAIHQYGYDFRLPKQIHEQLKQLSKVTSKLEQELGERPTIEEIAQRMKLSEEEISFLQSLKKRNKKNFDEAGSYSDNDDDTSDDEMLSIASSDTDHRQYSHPETSPDFTFLYPLDREIFLRSNGLEGHKRMTHAEILEDLNPKRKTKLTMENVQAHYNRAVLMDRQQG